MVTQEQLDKAYELGYRQAILEFRLRLPNKPSKLGHGSDMHIRAPRIRRKLRRLINIFKKGRKPKWG